MRVRGTQDQVKSIEVNVDTVYVRYNIQKINTEDFSGWEYDEVQYVRNTYLEMLTTSGDTDGVALLLSLLMAEIDMLRMEILIMKEGL